ncbi:hypothetical protein ACW4TU_42345 [Streptomyces sp. QTS52]
MASVMGLPEARETASRVQVEELRAAADRVPAELAEAEAGDETEVSTRAQLGRFCDQNLPLGTFVASIIAEETNAHHFSTMDSPPKAAGQIR